MTLTEKFSQLKVDRAMDLEPKKLTQERQSDPQDLLSEKLSKLILNVENRTDVESQPIQREGNPEKPFAFLYLKLRILPENAPWDKQLQDEVAALVIDYSSAAV